ncbi:MAG: cobalamin-dependent protein [Armatimonadota bacterium]|nr:cobalamin-dependent protein [Armatimonadota bacterium]
MNVLLINTNRETSPSPAIPLGLCAVASSAAAAGHSVTVEDLCFARNPLRRLAEALAKAKPDVIGLSVRNIDSSDSVRPTWFMPEIREIVRTCREYSPVPIAIGGPAVGLLPRPVLEYLEADYAVVGDGEAAFVELLSALSDGKDAGSPGIVRSRQAEPHPSPPLNGEGAGVPPPLRRGLGGGRSALSTQRSVPSPESPTHLQTYKPTDLDALPRTRVGDWIDMRPYLAHAAALPVQTKRGCAFECDYCLYGQIEGRTYRLRSPSAVADEIAELAAAYPGSSVEFVDSTFNYPEAHAIEVCEELIRRGRGIALQSVELNPAFCSDDLVTAMERAGFVSVGVTPESASDRVLSALRKGFTSDDVRRAAETLRRTNMLRLWIFLMGGPEETEETARQTIDFMESDLSDRDLVYITYGVRIYPGTGVHRRAIAEGVVSKEDDLLRPRFYVSPGLTLDRLWSLLGRSKFPSKNVIFASDGNQRGLRVVQRLSALLGARPPYWRHAPLMNKTIGRFLRRGGG